MKENAWRNRGLDSDGIDAANQLSEIGDFACSPYRRDQSLGAGFRSSHVAFEKLFAE
jgi:hypothetical protein